MGYIFETGAKLDSKEEVLRQAELKLVAARDLLRECRDYLVEGNATVLAGDLYAKITDFIGD